DIYVATNGTGSGTSWSDATNSLAGAVAGIPAESGAVTVWLSNGTHDVVGTIGAPTLESENTLIVRGKTGAAGDVVVYGDGANVVFKYDPYTQGYPITISDITITGGGAGGVDYCWLSNCVVAGNTGVVFGGIKNCIGQRCIISNNISDGVGGVYAEYGHTLYDSIVINNKGGSIGGVHGTELRHCIVKGNTGNTVGGIEFGGYVISCLIVDNLATNENGFGGVYFTACQNSTIANNTGTVGGAGGDQWFYNCISFENIGEQDGEIVRTVSSYSCGSGYTGTGSITSDPLFVGSGDYRLQAGSPCINAGTNSTWTTLTDTDLDGNKRRWPANGQTDMGAYEFGSGTVYRKKVFFMKTE
nr:choice-of-anchor Q domain-containing protein [Candidatus Sumerlaeota bacterium]